MNYKLEHILSRYFSYKQKPNISKHVNDYNSINQYFQSLDLKPYKVKDNTRDVCHLEHIFYGKDPFNMMMQYTLYEKHVFRQDALRIHSDIRREMPGDGQDHLLLKNIFKTLFLDIGRNLKIEDSFIDGEVYSVYSFIEISEEEVNQMTRNFIESGL